MPLRPRFRPSRERPEPEPDVPPAARRPTLDRHGPRRGPATGPAEAPQLSPAEAIVDESYRVIEAFVEEGLRYAEGMSAWTSGGDVETPRGELVTKAADLLGALARAFAASRRPEPSGPSTSAGGEARGASAPRPPDRPDPRASASLRRRFEAARPDDSSRERPSVAARRALHPQHRPEYAQSSRSSAEREAPERSASPSPEPSAAERERQLRVLTGPTASFFSGPVEGASDAPSMAQLWSPESDAGRDRPGQLGTLSSMSPQEEADAGAEPFIWRPTETAPED